jgi:hypothetical protein
LGVGYYAWYPWVLGAACQWRLLFSSVGQESALWLGIARSIGVGPNGSRALFTNLSRLSPFFHIDHRHPKGGVVTKGGHHLIAISKTTTISDRIS